MQEKYNPLKSAELSAEQNYNMIDGVMNNTPPALVLPEEKPLDKVKEPPRHKRNIPLYVMVSPEELEQLHARMDEAGVRNMSAFVRKMALNGYILHVDLSPVRELVSLQGRCSNNINQMAIHANTYGVYPDEIAGLQQDYAELWGRMNDILKQLSAIVEL